MNSLAKELWPQCERLYNSSRLSLLLNLQEQYGCSVNLLLLALYLDKNGLSLPSSTWSSLNQHAERFERRILRPYRRCRKQLKNQTSPKMYQAILNNELILERLLQQQLLALFPHEMALVSLSPASRPLITHNLGYYAQNRSLTLDLLTPIIQ